MKPGIPSPFTGKIHEWRLVDFDPVAKRTRTAHQLSRAQGYYINYLDRVRGCFPMIILLQPWD